MGKMTAQRTTLYDLARNATSDDESICESLKGGRLFVTERQCLLQKADQDINLTSTKQQLLLDSMSIVAIHTIKVNGGVSSRSRKPLSSPR